jgi:hypothetical protein
MQACSRELFLNALAYFAMAVTYTHKMMPGPNVIKLSASVIY